MDNPKQLRTLSLCTGYGGIERGLELAGEQLNVIAHVEVEAFAAANLVSKMESGELGAAPIWTDVKTFPVEPFRSRVDLLTGGYPCQPFSAAGKRAGKDDPRHLWPYIADIIESVRPTQCFFENVEGHISLGLREVLGSLEDLGYSATWGIFSATEVGAPHQRKRVYILAHANTNDGSRGSQQESEHHGAKEPLRDSQGGLGSLLANSSSEGLSQRHGEGAFAERQLYAESECGGGLPAQGGRGAVWAPEPRVGRVVDGCPDRVDRIRLLGNGVVPKTAAKAWVTLNKEMGND